MGRRHIQDQRGYILPLSLVIMLFGTLLVGSLLTYVGASVNTRAIARDNLNAYYTADAGIQLVIAKLIQADYKECENPSDPTTCELAPLPQRFDDGDGQMEYDESSEYYEYYTPSDLFPDASPPLSPDVNDYEVIMTVRHLDMWMPDYVEYEITASAFEPGASSFSEAQDKVTAIVRQVPYPIYEAWTYGVSILSWQRQ